EVARGCRWGCRFCLVCSINRPYRTADAGRVIELIGQRPETAGSVGLVGANLCDHPELERILSHVAGTGLQLGASSLRLETLDERILQLLRACKVRTVTLAPEAAATGLLASIGKRCDPELLAGTARLVGKAGFEQLKLYYMVGLPGEEAPDRQALVEQVREIRAVLPDRVGLKVSINPFIPKPQTRMQDEPMAGASSIKAAIRQVRRGLADLKGPGVRLQAGAVAESLAQAVISQGDRRLAGAIERACLRGERFLDTLADVGVDTAELLHRKRDPGGTHPWRVVETKI
ncbi:MAG: radical SAM protein, partial [Candidatus Glassbacteria bacterium]|nr:radical SAM protein [Candidatus Glassbacteria bacterium]